MVIYQNQFFLILEEWRVSGYTLFESINGADMWVYIYIYIYLSVDIRSVSVF
jgi:hypothetical protein